MRFFTGFFPLFLCSSASFYLQIKRYICLCSSRLSNFYLHAYFWKMKGYFISFHFFFLSRKVTLSLLQGCPWTEHSAHTALKKTDLRTLREVGARAVWSLFGESKAVKLFTDWFLCLLSKEKASRRESLQSPSLHQNWDFYVETIHTTLVATYSHSYFMNNKICLH